MKHGVGADPCSVPREALLAEMGVAMREDGGTLGVFSPKKVGAGVPRCCSDVARAGRAVAPFGVSVLWEAGGVPLGAGGAAPGTGLTAIPSCVGASTRLLTAGCPCGLRTSERSLSCSRSRLDSSRLGETGGPKACGAWSPQEACTSHGQGLAGRELRASRPLGGQLKGVLAVPAETRLSPPRPGLSTALARTWSRAPLPVLWVRCREA